MYLLLRLVVPCIVLNNRNQQGKPWLPIDYVSESSDMTISITLSQVKIYPKSKMHTLRNLIYTVRILSASLSA